MDNNEILLKELEKEKKIILEKYSDLEEELKRVKEELSSERQQLESILYSRSYKITQKLKKIIGR